jgi:hypothetical protein
MRLCFGCSTSLSSAIAKSSNEIELLPSAAVSSESRPRNRQVLVRWQSRGVASDRSYLVATTQGLVNEARADITRGANNRNVHLWLLKRTEPFLLGLRIGFPQGHDKMDNPVITVLQKWTIQ